MSGNQKGFTLFEILISVGILASISLFAINSISTQLENRTRLTQLNENQHGAHVAMGRIAQDLTHAFIINRKDVAEAGEAARAVKPFLTHTSQEGGLKFMTQGFDSLLANSGESNIAVVKYMLRQDPKDSSKQQLVRVVDTQLKESIDRSGVGVEQVLLSDTKEFRVTYWNGIDFIEGWDTTSGDKANRLPKMARIFLEVFVPLKEGEAPPSDKSARKTLALETIVYLLFAYGQNDVQTPLKEYKWK